MSSSEIKKLSLTNEKNDNNKRVLAKRYAIEKKLGSGNYGTAFLVIDLKYDELKVLKEVSIGDMDPDESVESVQEANLLSKLDNPYILKYHDSFLDGEYFCIITEYCEGGDLDVRFKQLKKQNKLLSEVQILDWTVQLLSAVNFLHSRRVLHRDLKARNVFLKNESIKIGDFGISKILNGTMDMAQTFTGTPYYMSPEVLKHEGYNSKSDIWSIGCLLYEMCTYKHAFEGQGLMGVMYKIIECDVPQLPDVYSKELNNILKKIFIKDPALRPGSSELLREPLIANHIKGMIRRLELIKNEDLDSTMVVRKDRSEIAKALNKKVSRQDLMSLQIDEQESTQKSDRSSTLNSDLNRDEPEPKVKGSSRELTPKEKLLLKKLQKADEEALKVGQMAKENLQERLMRDTFRRESTHFNSSISHHIPNDYKIKSLSSSLGPVVKSSYHSRDNKADTFYSSNNHFNNSHLRTHYSDDYDDDDDINGFDLRNKTSNKNNDNDDDDGTLLKTMQTLSYDTRPIAPLKKQFQIEKDFDEDGIPLDPQLTNEYYNNFQDFENDDDDTEGEEKLPVKSILKKVNNSNNTRNSLSKTIEPSSKKKSHFSSRENDKTNYYDEKKSTNLASKTLGNNKNNAEYEHLVNIKKSLIENPKTQSEKTFGDGSASAFGAQTRGYKIQNLRTQAIRGLGEETFEKCYKFLKEKRRGQKSDESKIFEGLKKITPNTKDCFLVDQLLFLEEQI